LRRQERPPASPTDTKLRSLLSYIRPIFGGYYWDPSNAVVLWNSTYLSAIVDQLRAQGVPVKDGDVARLSPLGHAHLNCLGRYAIASSAPDKGLRPLGVAALPQDASSAVVDEDGV
jgi:hypothetical protein